MNAFITSQFGYCPLVWMCHNRNTLRQVNRIHERALQIVDMDNNLTFEDLLKKCASLSIHNRNLQQLAVEIYKALNNLSSSLMRKLFRVNEMKYSLCNKNSLVSNIPCTIKYGSNTITFGSKNLGSNSK